MHLKRLRAGFRARIPAWNPVRAWDERDRDRETGTERQKQIKKKK